MFRKYLSARGVFWLFLALVFVFYVTLPLSLSFVSASSPYYALGAWISVVAIAGMLLGFRSKAFNNRFVPAALRLSVRPGLYIRVVFLIFVAFFALTLATAPSIPLISAFVGSDVNQLSFERGEFLKGRQGGWIFLLYLSSLVSSTLVPYAIVLAYLRRDLLRHAFAAVYLFFCVVFLVKALFLTILLPILSALADRGKLSARVFLASMATAILGLLLMTRVSGYDELEGTGAFTIDEYFSASYVASSTLDFLVYRSLAVPVMTVADTLFVHATRFDGQNLGGATSTLLATAFGLERVNLERLVFEHQYGGWNDFGNSNVFFAVDGFVNFGWLGVFFFGLLVGFFFKVFRLSSDLALRSLGLLFAFQLISSPLTGVLFSNGFLLMLLQGLFVKVKDR
jgi:hypothetical protein